jgi:outer membrane protein assembly factor BamB
MVNRTKRAIRQTAVWGFAASLFLGAATAHTAEWPHWRGPNQDGSSPETGLVSSWEPGGNNMVWRADFVGRSTPVVLNGRVYVIGRGGKDITEQERVTAFDAGTGEVAWEHRFNVFHTTIPFNRVGWASLAGDAETGNIYAHGVQGLFICLDKNGKVLWERSLTEEYGRISGYGGRTNTPFIDGDLVIVSYLNTAWGKLGIPRHRYYAFDKNTGELVWVSTPGGQPLDTTYSTPVVAEVNGQRLLICGNADGAVYALKVQTGEKVWGFALSKRGINSSVAYADGRVFASHSEENLDNTSLGRVVAIDATTQGDAAEVWRYDDITVGYASLATHGGRVYFIDNSANLHCVDAASGKEHWSTNIGTVGKGSPIVADGKVYATEVNGHFSIVDAISGELLDKDQVQVKGEDRFAEIYGSPAIAYGRIYFATEEGVYCLGDKNQKLKITKGQLPAGPQKAPKGTEIAHLQLVPFEVLAKPGDKVEYELRAFDAHGRFIKKTKATWSLERVQGKINKKGKLSIGKKAPAHVGHVVAKMGALEARARVRIIPSLPWKEDFGSLSAEQGKNRAPGHWVAAGRFKVTEKDGNKMLVKPPAPSGLHRSQVYIGPATKKGYTIQADMLSERKRRIRPDMGLIAGRYILDMQGNHQRLQLRSWTSDLRMAKTIDFAWDTDVWYTAKLRVDLEDGQAVVRGKVWPRDQAEPAAWTIEVVDPLPNPHGSPGIYGYSPANVYYDNLNVWKSE